MNKFQVALVIPLGNAEYDGALEARDRIEGTILSAKRVETGAESATIESHVTTRGTLYNIRIVAAYGRIPMILGALEFEGYLDE